MNIRELPNFLRENVHLEENYEYFSLKFSNPPDQMQVKSSKKLGEKQPTVTLETCIVSKALWQRLKAHTVYFLSTARVSSIF